MVVVGSDAGPTLALALPRLLVPHAGDHMRVSITEGNRSRERGLETEHREGGSHRSHRHRDHRGVASTLSTLSGRITWGYRSRAGCVEEVEVVRPSLRRLCVCCCCC